MLGGLCPLIACPSHACDLRKPTITRLVSYKVGPWIFISKHVIPVRQKDRTSTSTMQSLSSIIACTLLLGLHCPL